MEGFHIRAAYRMAKRNKPHWGLGHQLIYPKLEDVLDECGLHTIAEYINVHWQTITVYVAICLILDKCMQGERK